MTKGRLRIILTCVVALAWCPPEMQAQFQWFNRPVQVHGFVSQGFAYSNQNNYLTMKTSAGDFRFTDGGINISSQINDHLRVAAQAYVRNIGELGAGRVELDFGLVDYRFKDWFGIRAGKVKSTMGLYNDTQDMEFLHTWAILPQSTYPLDLRASTIAHVGGDVYGNLVSRRMGSLGYTVFGGIRPDDSHGGYRYGLYDVGLDLSSFTGYMIGTDLHWNTPARGLTTGISHLRQTTETVGVLLFNQMPVMAYSKADWTWAYYAQYAWRDLRIDAEYRRNWLVVISTAQSDINLDKRGMYISAAYRLSKRVEVGIYHSRYYGNWRIDLGSPANHIFDQTSTVRFDITRHWNVKVEGHFIDGYGSSNAIHGFYIRTNPNGLSPKTNMLVIRTAFSL